MKPQFRFFKEFTLLAFLILAFSSCDSSDESNSETQQIVATEAVLLIEEFADAVSDDCDDTIQQWNQIDPRFVNNNLIVFNPKFNTNQEERAWAAFSQIEDGVTRCIPGSDFSSNQETLPGSPSVDCSWCPLSAWKCFLFSGGCAGGDRQACCYFSTCFGDCINICESSNSCDIPPNGGE